MTSFARVSTNMQYGQSMKRLSDLQAQLDKTQRHMSANTRLLTPADDPVAAAKALDLKQGQSMNTQFASNRGNAQDALKLQESTLNSFGTRIQDIQRLLIQAGDGAYEEEQLKVIANEIEAIRNELVGYANTRDAYSNYIFSGHEVTIQPFDMTVTGKVSYKGDDGQLMVQVDSARYMPATDSGKNIFMNIKGLTASRVEMTATSDTSNIHNLVVDVDIKDETLLQGYDDPTRPGFQYRVEFDGKTPVASYKLYRSDDGGANWTQMDENGQTTDALGNPITTEYPYTSDDKNTMEIEVDGVRFSIKGEVEAGDVVTIIPGANRATDVFDYINEAIDLLNNTTFSEHGGSTNLALGLEALNTNMASALDKILTARADAGTRLKELDALDVSGTDKNLQYTESISELEGLDYYKAISDMYMQQLTLQAAQQTFMATRNLSLFSLM